MKKQLLFFSIILTTILISNAQTLVRLIDIPWNTKNGLTTRMDASGNYGLMEFKMIDEDHVTIYCDVENAIKVYKLSSDELIDSFKVNKPVSRFDMIMKINSTFLLIILGKFMYTVLMVLVLILLILHEI